MKLLTFERNVPQVKSALKFFSSLIRLIPVVSSNDVWIAGGALRDFFSGKVKEIRDIDVFFSSSANAKAFERYILQNGAKLIRRSVNSCTYKLSNKYSKTLSNCEIDVVHRYFPTPEDCLKSFDFTVICCALRYTQESPFICSQDFLLDLPARKLRFQTEQKDLPQALTRIKKYVDKGFKFSPKILGELIKPHVDILDDINVGLMDDEGWY